MAKNYTIAEFVRTIAANNDLEALTDLGKRYPLLSQMVARITTLAGDEFVNFMGYMPEYVSANKVNASVKKQFESVEADEDDEEEEVDEKPAKKPAKAKAKTKPVEDDEDEDEDAEPGDSDYDYDSMSNAKMYKLLGDLGKRKDCKAKFGDLSHASMAKYLKKFGPKPGDTETADAEEEDDATDYYSMSALELYKLCKERKIKAEQKQTIKYYADLLEKADAKAAKKEEPEEEEDDWGSDEEEKPAKKAKKAKAEKAPKKPAKKQEVEEDEDDAEDEEDDDWEI